MAETTYFKTEFDDERAVLTVTLSREDNERNQLNTGMVLALREILEPHTGHNSIKGLILASARGEHLVPGACLLYTSPSPRD